MRWLWLLALSSLVFYACKKNDKLTPVLEINKTSINVKTEGQKDTLTITSNVDWTLTIPADLDWITADKKSGQAGTSQVILVIAANTSSNRSADLVLGSEAAGVVPVKVKISQSPSDVSITSFTTHAAEGGIITIAGTGFSKTLAENQVTINGKVATVTEASSTSLKVTMPTAAGDGPLKITVVGKSATSTNNIIYDWKWQVTTLVGTGDIRYIDPRGLLLDATGQLYIADGFNNRIRKLVAKGGGTYDAEILAGSEWGSSGAVDDKGMAARFYRPGPIAFDKQGNIVVLDGSNQLIRKVATDGTVTTIRDNMGNPFNLKGLSGIAIGANNEIFAANYSDSKVHTYIPGGTSAVYANGGAIASFLSPSGLVRDANGALFMVETGTHRISKVVANPGGEPFHTVIAGDINGVNGNIDDVGSAARFDGPIAIAMDDAGNLYVTEWYGKIRKLIKNADGSYMATTIVGNAAGFKDGLNTEAQFKVPTAIAVNNDGTVLYVGDENYRVRKLVRLDH